VGAHTYLRAHNRFGDIPESSENKSGVHPYIFGWAYRFKAISTEFTFGISNFIPERVSCNL
jgi:hypothetical protein